MNHRIALSGSARAESYLVNKTLLLIGGDSRPTQLAILVKSFPHTRFIWRRTRESNASIRGIEHLILRDDVSLVVILHGLSRHGHSLGARQVCSQVGKPLLWCHRPTPTSILRSLLSHRTWSITPSKP